MSHPRFVAVNDGSATSWFKPDRHLAWEGRGHRRERLYRVEECYVLLPYGHGPGRFVSDVEARDWLVSRGFELPADLLNLVEPESCLGSSL